MLCGLQEKHLQNRGLGSYHNVLQELLEGPQLIETCIRNNNYDEALDLLTFVQKVAHAAPAAPAVKRLVTEAGRCQKSLLEQLLGKLSRAMTLAECLRCVSYLRRLHIFTEANLRLRFLQCREHWCVAPLRCSCRVASVMWRFEHCADSKTALVAMY